MDGWDLGAAPDTGIFSGVEAPHDGCASGRSTQGAYVASGVEEGSSKEIENLLERVKSNRKDHAAWMDLAVAYRQLGDHSHQVWAWSRAVEHKSSNRHCRKFGHLLRFKESPDSATCLYCGEAFELGEL